MKKTIPLLLALTLLMLVGITLTRHLPLFAGLFYTLCTLLLLGACPQSRWRPVLYNSAFVFLALGLAESLFSFRDRNVPQAINLQPLPPGYFADDAIRGYAPEKIPRRYRHVRAVSDGRPLWDVVYTIGANGLRVTPSESSDPIWFFGDSITYGEGLADRETFPWLFSELTDFQAHNFAFIGYGAHQMLRMLETGFPREIDSRQPRWIVYTGILAHIDRAAGHYYFTRRGPFYRVEGGLPVYKGRIRDQFLLPDLVERYLVRSSIYNEVVAPLRFRNGKNVDLERYVAIVKRARDLAENEYHAPFLFVFWDTDDPDPTVVAEADRLEQLLANAGIRVVRLSRHVPQIFETSFTYPVDGHPNALAQPPVAELLARLFAEFHF